MVTLRNFIMTAFGLFLLTQCNTKEDNSTVAPSIAVTKVDNPLLGEWKYDNTIWYSSELTLHNDGTFTYHNQSCNGQRFSQGQWTSTNGSLSLTSFNAFKEKEQVAAVKKVEIRQTNKPKRKLRHGVVEYSFVDFKVTTVPSLPTAGDTVRVYLDNIQLQLRNDTLYCIGSNKLPEDAKFYRTKNNR
jgi:hypothetical protein